MSRLQSSSWRSSRSFCSRTGYSAWGTRQVLDACAVLTPDQLDQGLGASHSSILQTLRHIHDGERVWLRRLIEVDNEMLRAFDIKPPNTDLTAYYATHRP